MRFRQYFPQAHVPLPLARYRSGVLLHGFTIVALLLAVMSVLLLACHLGVGHDGPSGLSDAGAQATLIFYGAVSLTCLAVLFCSTSLIRLIGVHRQVERTARSAEHSLHSARMTIDALRICHQRNLIRIRQAERKRIAEELHDSTQQHLVAIELYLMQVRRSVHPASTLALVDSAVASARTAQRELRALTYLLFPTELMPGGLSATVRSFVEGFARRTNLDGKVVIGASIDDIPVPAQQALLRVIQEALLNVHRHADATAFWVKLERIGPRVTAIVEDNGRGVLHGGESGTVTRLGVGMSSMRSRLKSIGGELTVAAGEVGVGTRIYATAVIRPQLTDKVGKSNGYARAG